MSGPNDNGQTPPHMGSQPAPQGNHTQAQPSFEKQVLALQQREAQVRKQLDSIKGMVSMDDLKGRAQKDRASVLKELGLDDLIPKDDSPTAHLQRQFEDLQNQLAQEKRLKEESDYFNSVRSGLSQKPDEYELIDKLGAHDQLFDYLRQNRESPDGAPDPYEAASQMENNLIETLKKALSAKKMQPFIQEMIKSMNPQPQGNKPNHPLDVNKTLNAGDRPGQTQQPQERRLTHQEQIEQAARLIKFNTQG